MGITTIYRGEHVLWVCAVGITTMYRGEHMPWVYAVDDIVYSVGHKIHMYRCGPHRYMMWVTWLSTLYIHVIHIIYPRYMIVYTVGHMLWTTSIYDVGDIMWAAVHIYRGSCDVDNIDI